MYDTITHLKVGIDVLGHDKLGLGFVLTIDNVHLKLSVVLFEKVAKLHGVLHALLKILQKVTGKEGFLKLKFTRINISETYCVNLK